MSSPLHNQIQQRLVELRERRQVMARIQQELAETQTTVASKNHAISVTVDSRGELADIRFRTNSYRTMAPAELAQLLMDTVKAARTEARAAVAEAFAPLLPAGTPLLDMMNGTVDFEAMMRDTIPMPDDPAASDLARIAKNEGARSE
jgi:DNA-binding protein YbaB